MNRAQAHAWLQASGFNVLMAQIERATGDDDAGYGPALDRAFAIYGRANGHAPPYTGIEVQDGQQECFTALLSATTYDLIITAVAAMVDTSIDAPLTTAKFSQFFRQVQTLRDAAWQRAAACGYESGSVTVAGHVVNLGFLEPPDPKDLLT